LEAREITRRVRDGLERGRNEPVGHQVVQIIWEAVIAGEVATGERLPTSRQVAVELGVSPRVVERAYEELERLGVTVTRAGEGTFVGLNPPAEAERVRRRELDSVCRGVVARAAELGFSVDELLEVLSDYREVNARARTESV
jgi:GntR family transcriptional regulator